MYKCYVCSHELPGSIRPFPPIQLIGCDQCMNVSQITWLDNIPTLVSMPDYKKLEKFVPDGSVLAKILATVPKALTQLPILAEIPQRVVATIPDPISSVQDIVAIIEEDAVLSIKILSLANSAYFATVGEINDLVTACSRLGMREMANIATTMSSMNQYKTSNAMLESSCKIYGSIPWLLRTAAKRLQSNLRSIPRLHSLPVCFTTSERLYL